MILRKTFAILGLLAIVAAAPLASAATILIDDHFDNSDLATDVNGVNGSFASFTNGVANSGSAAEPAGTLAVVSNGAGSNGVNDYTGMKSSNSFDAGVGFNMTAVVDSMTTGLNSAANGLFIGVTADDAGTFLFGDTRGAFGLTFHANAASSSVGGVALNWHHGGASGVMPTGYDLLSSGTDLIDLASLEDGFTASITADAAGWSFSVSDVEVGGLATTVSDSGAWGTFDFTEFTTVEYATLGAQGSLTHSYDRITVEAVPEPSSIALIGIGGSASPITLKRLADRREFFHPYLPLRWIASAWSTVERG